MDEQQKKLYEIVMKDDGKPFIPFRVSQWRKQEKPAKTPVEVFLRMTK